MIVIGLSLVVAAPREASCACEGAMLDIVTDLCWDCMYPIKIGGEAETSPGPEPDTTNIAGVTCECPSIYDIPRYGLTFSMWQPNYYIEVVHTPYCFPGLGTSMSSNGITLGGSSASVNHMGTHDTPKALTFYQSHLFQFEEWSAIEGSIINGSCVEANASSPVDISELDDYWNDDHTSLLVAPETILFANEIAQLSCMADAPLALIGGPAMSGSNALFWCMGSWGSAYPMTGHIGDADMIQGAAGIAARYLYKNCREMQMYDGAIWQCAFMATPIWMKQDWRLQIARPVAQTWDAHPIGRTALLWEENKNLPFRSGANKADEFVFILWNKINC